VPQEGCLQAARTYAGPSVPGPKEWRRRAEHARRAYSTRLALASAKARRTKRSGGAAA
jgi:hypothetical protein